MSPCCSCLGAACCAGAAHASRCLLHGFDLGSGTCPPLPLPLPPCCACSQSDEEAAPWDDALPLADNLESCLTLVGGGQAGSGLEGMPHAVRAAKVAASGA